MYMPKICAFGWFTSKELYFMLLSQQEPSLSTLSKYFLVWTHFLYYSCIPQHQTYSKSPKISTISINNKIFQNTKTNLSGCTMYMAHPSHFVTFFLGCFTTSKEEQYVMLNSQQQFSQQIFLVLNSFLLDYEMLLFTLL